MKERKVSYQVRNFFLIAVIAALLLSPSAKKPEAAPAPFTWPNQLVIATFETGTAHHVTMSAIAPVLEKSTGMKVRVTPGDAVIGYNDTLAGKVDINVTGFSDWIPIQTGQFGSAAYPKGQFEIMYVLFGVDYVFYTTGDSKLMNIYDLKKGGYKAATPKPVASIAETMEKALPAFLGWTPEEAKKYIKYVELGSYDAYINSVMEGNADICYVSTTSARAYEIAATVRGIRVLDMPLNDKEGWARFMRAKPGVLPSKVAEGVGRSIGHVGFSVPNFLTVTDKMDQELVYQLTKWFHQNYDAYKGAHENCAKIRMETFRKFLNHSPFPVAKGTIKYLKEIGQWTAEDDKWNEEASNLTRKYVKAWDDAAAEAKAKGIKISATNKEWLDLYAKHKADIPPIIPRL